MTVSRLQRLALAATAVVLAALAFGSLEPGVRRASGDTGTGTAHLEIDLNTANGTCTTIDAAAAINVGDSITFALCLNDFASAPIGGNLTSFQVSVGYTDALLSAVNGPFGANTDLDANPNFNQAAVAGAWDCNSLNAAGSQPTAHPSPIFLACEGPISGSAVSSAVLATVTMSGQSGGAAVLSWNTQTGFVAGAEEPLCGAGIVCSNATITVSGAVANTPTNTATASPTASGTPATSTPTLSPTPLGRGVTYTATGTVTPVAVDTATPAPTGQEPPPAGAPGGAAQTPRSGITLPDTGGGAGPDGSDALPLTFLALSLATLGVAFLRATVTRRTRSAKQ